MRLIAAAFAVALLASPALAEQPDPQLCMFSVRIAEAQRDRANNEIIEAGAQANLLNQKNAALEKENTALKQQIDDLKKAAAQAVAPKPDAN